MGNGRSCPVRRRAPNLGFGAGAALLLLAVGLGGAPAPARAVEPRADPALAALETRLAELIAGRLPDEVDVDALFLVDLVDVAAIDARVASLQQELATLDAALLRSSPEVAEEGALASDEAARQRRSVARARLDYLRRLAPQLRAISQPARAVLRELREPRDALRAHTEALVRARIELETSAGRLVRLAARARSGTVVGFRSELVALADEVRAAAGSLTQRGTELAAIAASFTTRAEGMELEAARVRRAVLLRATAAPSQTTGRSAAATEVDALFLAHVSAQRGLRRRVASSTTDGEVGSRALIELAASVAPDPDLVKSSAEVQRALESSYALVEAAHDLVAAERGALLDWSLAFENDMMRLLAEVASSEARAEAYAFSAALLEDLRGELGLAWRSLRAEVAGLVSTDLGLRGAFQLTGHLTAVGAFLALWLFVRRRSGWLVARVVRGVLRVPRLRLGVGGLVRWGGLAEAVLPVLATFPLYAALRDLVGGDGHAPALLAAGYLPAFGYLLGRDALLGATRRVTRGRPPLIAVRPAALERMRRSYTRLGSVVAVATGVSWAAQALVGDGRIASLVALAAITWTAAWATWEAVSWRVPLAQSWRALLGEASREAPVAAWMERSRPGFVLSPLVAARVIGAHAWRALQSAFGESGVGRRLRTQRLLRSVRSGGSEDVATPLPKDYLDAFPLYPVLGDGGAVLLPRKSLMEDVLPQIGRWRETRSEGSLLLLGEKGIGKTTFCHQLARQIAGVDVVLHTVSGRPTSESELLEALAPCTGGVRASVDEAATALLAGPERVILLDEAHNVFLRMVGGYGAYDALTRLVNRSSDRVFWGLIFNSFAWSFLDESRSRLHYFRRLLRLEGWGGEELGDLIARRNQRTGYEIVFDPVLLPSGAGRQFELMERAEDFFRVLAEASAGNPRVATRLWLDSLTLVDERTLHVGRFRELPSERVRGLSDDLVFALAAICQHENLSASELARVLNMSESFASFALQYLGEAGLVESKPAADRRFTLAPAAYRPVVQHLRSRSLLFG